MSVRRRRLDRREFLARLIALAANARYFSARPDRLRLSGSTYMLAAAT